MQNTYIIDSGLGDVHKVILEGVDIESWDYYLGNHLQGITTGMLRCSPPWTSSLCHSQIHVLQLVQLSD